MGEPIFGNVYEFPRTPEVKPQLVGIDTASTHRAYEIVAENVGKVATKFWRDPNRDTSLMGVIDDTAIHTHKISLLRNTIPLSEEELALDVPADQKRWLSKKPDLIRKNGLKVSEVTIKTPHNEMSALEAWSEAGVRHELKEYMAQHGDLPFYTAYEMEKAKPDIVDERYLLVARESIRLFLFGVGGKRFKDGLKHSLHKVDLADIESAKQRHPSGEK